MLYSLCRASLVGALTALLTLASVSCSSSSTATSREVCASYERGLLLCNNRQFDTTECNQDLACLFALYRTAASDFYVRCADRFDRGECPSLEDYQCKGEEAVAAPSTLARDFVAAFQNKQSACAGSTLKGDVYSASSYVRDELLTESRPCLDRSCPDVNACLEAAVARAAPACK